jgi:hypothetical protein
MTERDELAERIKAKKKETTEQSQIEDTRDSGAGEQGGQQEEIEVNLYEGLNEEFGRGRPGSCTTPSCPTSRR